MFTVGKDALRTTVAAYHQSPQPISCATSLLVSLLGELTLPSMSFCREFTQILSSHRSLQGFDEGCSDALIFAVEGFSAVVDPHPGLFAQKLIVGTLICILEASPSAHVIHQDRLVSGLRG